jgi:hypothetical protein
VSFVFFCGYLWKLLPESKKSWTLNGFRQFIEKKYGHSAHALIGLKLPNGKTAP